MKLNSENLNINLRHLRAIHAVAAQGNFARAAAELGVVPSALTETVRQIELALGAPLFDRALRPPQPTPLGLSLLEETQPLLDGLDRAVVRARAAGGLSVGQLAIGAAPSAISGLVGPTLARFRAAHPAIRCRLHDDLGQRLADMVVEGALDLAVAGPARDTAELSQQLIETDPIGLACHADHPLAARASVRLEEIDPDQMISLDDETGTRRLIESEPAVPGELKRGAVQCHSTVAQLCLIRAGLGLALLPERAVGLFGDPAIRFVPVADLSLHRSLYLLQPARRARSHVAQAFAGFLAEFRKGSRKPL
ncbi:LysR family transcriptional regulator [Frigidibacter sp. MR17.24]|uniref:LysR family transcriptional regulator n=1 Tax=Frigidibacter sp. MR17.24 TaxID=3127345 RepID=UPI0030130C73